MKERAFITRHGSSLLAAKANGFFTTEKTKPFEKVS